MFAARDHRSAYRNCDAPRLHGVLELTVTGSARGLHLNPPVVLDHPDRLPNLRWHRAILISGWTETMTRPAPVKLRTCGTTHPAPRATASLRDPENEFCVASGGYRRRPHSRRVASPGKDASVDGTTRESDAADAERDAAAPKRRPAGSKVCRGNLRVSLASLGASRVRPQGVPRQSRECDAAESRVWPA